MRRRWTDSLAECGTLTLFTLRTLVSLPAAVRRPRLFGHQLYHMLFGSLLVALVAGAALGIVSWLQLHGLLFRFQSVSLLPSALAVAVVWELGPVTAGLIAAGRIGAGLGAEFGSMRLTEQLDAAEVLGIVPLRRLVAPRVVACMLVLPLLTILIDYVAIGGSFAAEMLGGSLTWTQYRTECIRYLHWRDVAPASLKSIVFGFGIGVIGCFCGSEATGGTEGVGRAATRAVVWSTLFVLIADVVLVRLIQVGQSFFGG